jgi:glycolate oxidase FAD binding subunit
MPSSERSKFSVDSLEPHQSRAPKSADEIGGLLRQANNEDWCVIPFGAGSKQHIGNLLKKFDLVLSMENFNQILEYEPQDLVVKVGSGCRLVDLQERLAQDHLCLPIDPDATLGGIVSCHDSGPLRFSQGTIRDYLLGLSLVQPDGSWTKFGSRVVKNVTGYDMCKLYTGAFGTLGILVDFFFKLKPLPISRKTVVAAVPNLTDVREAVSRLLRSALVPSAVEFLNPSAHSFLNKTLDLTMTRDCHLLIVRFGDVERAVQWQIEQLEKLWSEFVTQRLIVGDLAEELLLWRWLREDRLWLRQQPSAIKLKVNCLPNRLVETVQSLESLGRELDAEVLIKSHAGNGVIRAYLRLEASAEAVHRFTELVQHLRSTLRPWRGTVIVECAPLAFKAALDVWGYDFKDRVLMQQIRQQFDPKRILNAGRFVV